MAVDVRTITDLTGLISYFSQTLKWHIDVNDFEDIDDITYGFDAADIGLKEEAFAKILSLRQLPPLVNGQKWGIFCVEFDSARFEVSALRKVLSGLIPKRRNSADHAVWDQKDLLFICFWGSGNERTIGIAHFKEQESGLPQIKMISCAPAVEDFTQIRVFEDRLSHLAWPQNTDTDAWRAAWSDAFDTGYRQVIRDSATLTAKLAAVALDIRDRILSVLEVESANGYVHLLMEKFRSTLIHDMTEQQFADMYAQTVVYGLFSARCMDKSQEDFSAAEAVGCIPNTNPFLRSLMKECIGTANSSKLSFDELEVGNVVELLKHTNTETIMRDFNRQTGGGREDPVIHFYEEFLSAYDKTQRVQRGVYYTPQPVVNFIVRAVDDILKSEFGIAEGLASTKTKTIKVMRESKRKVDGRTKQIEDTEEVPAIQILDPATGTGTFLRQTILQIWDNFQSANASKSKAEIARLWNEYVPKHLLPRLNGFELMMAPYAVAHMKLAMVLKETGYDFSGDERVKVFLTNSLEDPGDTSAQLTFFNDPLALESIEANRCKKNNGINVIIGNPPYSTESSNKGEWIEKLMNRYKKEADGRTKLQEKNSKPLNDDYIKFLCFGHHIMDKVDKGVLAYINPHGFADGPIFRGMRSALLASFDSIYLLDLHGNANRQQISQINGKDENVFDIKQGVCIVFLVKGLSGRTSKKARVFREDFWGTREEKYQLLQTIRLADIEWREVTPTAPLNFFYKVNMEKEAKYETGFSIRDLFSVNGTGVLTKRDNLCIHYTPGAALKSAEDMSAQSTEYVVAKYRIPADVRDWKYEWAKRDVMQNGLNESLVKRITYRPFDNRYAYYTGVSRGFMGWPVHTVMRHIINEPGNVSLITARSNKSGDCSHFFVSNSIVEYKCGERTTNSSVFPLFLKEDYTFTKEANFNHQSILEINKKLGLSLSEEFQDKQKFYSPLELFSYIYAVLYSPSYRKTYKVFLNQDFPRIPYPTNREMFWKMAALGDYLCQLHLMKSSVLDEIDVDSLIAGRYPIEKVTYRDSCVYVNKSECFHDVPELAWEFYIGGYQPAQKWLKDRKGTILSADDIKHYRKIIRALTETDRIMKEIDEVFKF